MTAYCVHNISMYIYINIHMKHMEFLGSKLQSFGTDSGVLLMFLTDWYQYLLPDNTVISIEESPLSSCIHGDL